MSIRMLAVDLDGTLLTDDKRISDTNREALTRITAEGVRVILSTGRAWPGAKGFAAELGLGLPVITSNGAMIVDSATEEILYQRDMETEAAFFVIEEGVRRGTSQIIWSRNRLYGLPVNERLQDYGRRFGRMTPQPAPLAMLEEDGISKVLWYDTEENIAQWEKELAPREDRSTERFPNTKVVTSTPTFLEFFHRGVSKATAIATVAAMYGIAKEEIAAIGDADNDLPMLAEAGLAIAMGNGTERVKAAADRITLDNEHDGVAYAVEHFLAE
ncbi:MAG: HAD family phosphatase [Lachnospiraceae bacterium]|nr:HAD family phosphatase [Lachnospiraceae bacterium]